MAALLYRTRGDTGTRVLRTDRLCIRHADLALSVVCDLRHRREVRVQPDYHKNVCTRQTQGLPFGSYYRWRSPGCFDLPGTRHRAEFLDLVRPGCGCVYRFHEHVLHVADPALVQQADYSA